MLLGTLRSWLHSDGRSHPRAGHPFFSCAAGVERVVVEKHDGARVEIGEHVIRTPERCHHWLGEGDIVARRTGYDEVYVTKTDVPVDVVVRTDEIELREPDRFEEHHEWWPGEEPPGAELVRRAGRSD